MTPSNIYIFYNPKSGRFSKKKVTEIHKRLEAAFGNCISISNIDELKAVRNAHIVVVGGDGTFHVAINHADLLTNTFSLLPAGSGNDFITGFEASDIDHLCENIGAKRVQEVDLILAGSVYAHTVSGIGFEALVSKKANESKNPFPALKFILPVARYMFAFKPREVRISSDDFDWSGEAFMVSMGNGKRAGGGFKLFPRAELNDGKLDLLIIKRPSVLQKLLYVWLVNFGKHLKLKVVEYHQLSSLHISFPGSTLLNADGDVYETEGFDVSVKQGVLKFIP